jgi:hypothetical protein
MNIKLIEGHFNSTDALDLIVKLIHTKIAYHEGKIAIDSNEEDIKYRESKIKYLQKELYDVRKYFETLKGNLKISADILVN